MHAFVALIFACFDHIFLQTEKWDEDMEEGTFAGIK